MAFDYIFKGAPTTPAPGASATFGVDVANNVQYTGFNGVWTPDLPAKCAAVDLTAQSASIAATTAYAVPTSRGGSYRVSYIAKVTTVDAVSSTLGPLQVKYTDADDSVVVTAPTAGIAGVTQSTVNTTAGGWIGGDFVVNAKAGTNIQYIMGYTSNTPGQMIYSLHLRVEFLG